MAVWHYAMLGILPFMGGKNRLRTWLVLMGASLVANLLPIMAVPWYVPLDAVAGAIVMRHPAGCAQRAIGALFALMVIYSVGFILADNPAGADTYLDAQTLMGWVQFGCLLAWGLTNVGKALVGWLRPGSRLLAHHDRV